MDLDYLTDKPLITDTDNVKHVGISHTRSNDQRSRNFLYCTYAHSLYQAFLWLVIKYNIASYGLHYKPLYICHALAGIAGYSRDRNDRRKSLTAVFFYLRRQLRMKAFTDPVRLYVTTITVDTTQAFRPIVPPVEQPVSMKEVFPWILGVLVVALLGLVIWYVLKHRKPRVDENGEPVRGRVTPPYDKAIGDLESLKQQKLWQVGKVKEYYSSLSDIAREYIEGQFNVNAVEMTTDDILRDVRELRFDQEIYDKLKDTMELSDLVKFAKYTTSPLENDNAMSDMTDFVNKSYEHYQALKAKEEEVSHV